MGNNYSRGLEKLMEERKESYCKVGTCWSHDDPSPQLISLLLQTLQTTLLVDLIYVIEYG